MKTSFTVSLLILWSSTTATIVAAKTPPNIVVFIVDDLGWNQVGYHASRINNEEIHTPNFDKYAAEGIEIDRGYMTPWCGPSRAALLTGRTNSYNPNITNNIWDHSFDDDIGFVGGLKPGTKTLAKALKDHSANYTAYYSGKWGIGGGSWANTPVGMGFDKMLGFWGDSLETCDAWHSWTAIPPFVTLPTDKKRAPIFVQTMPGYWEQQPDGPDNQWCGYFQEQAALGVLTEEEAQLGCKTQPRKLEKLLDVEILEDVIGNIESHDYEAGPLFQVHAPQLIHTPMNYPKEFDYNSPNPDQPEYFQEGKEKPPASNSDHRLAMNNAITFVDHMFGQVMQSLKDQGQWDNTIVLFTSDNGGAIYTSTASNNYPLRGSKFSGFDGGIRVPQFLTGGWIDQNTPQTSENRRSETFMFPQDWAPTLLEMAGGDASQLLGKNAAANGPYGSAMWDYISQSVTAGAENVQKVRKASLSYYFFFDVQDERTMKMVETGDGAVMTPRKWAPVWPKDDDYLPGQSDLSVRPCRPGGEALQCCYTDVLNDPEEDDPLTVDCDSMTIQARELYPIEGGCDENAADPMCLEPGSIFSGVLPENAALWSTMGSPGPWLNSRGRPVKDDLSVDCLCQVVEEGVNVSDVNSFTATIFSPFECHSASEAPSGAIPCNGNITIDPQVMDWGAFAAEGFPVDSLAKMMEAEQERKLAFNVPLIFDTWLPYANREGHEDWPNLPKFPHNAMGLDTCPEKGATPVPLPVTMITPYIIFAPYEFKVPAGQLDTLCARYTLSDYYCPSKHNPLQTGLDSWNYSLSSPPVGFLSDGSTIEAISFDQCKTECAGDYEGTAFVKAGSDNWGLAVSSDDDIDSGTSGGSSENFVFATALMASLAVWFQVHF